MNAMVTTETKETISPRDFTAVLGGVLVLADQSPLHRQYLIGELTANTAPAVLTGQYRYYENSETGQPLAFVCWAMTNDQGRAKLAMGENLDGADEWTDGDQLVFVELLVPNGDVQFVQSDLAANVFPAGTTGDYYRPVYDDAGDFQEMKMNTWRFDASGNVLGRADRPAVENKGMFNGSA